jgi:hypothetical protein
MLLDISSISLLKFLLHCTLDLHNAKLPQMRSTENEQCHRWPGQDDEFIVSCTDKSAMGRSCVTEEDALASDSYCIVSCPTSNQECEAGSHPHYEQGVCWDTMAAVSKSTSRAASRNHGPVSGRTAPSPALQR